MTFKDTFQENLEKLDLQGTILIIGLLSQRALELMTKETPKKSKIISSASSPELLSK